MKLTLREVIDAVRDEKLSKDQLEKYRDQLSYLAADMQFRMADLKKAEAKYFIDKQEDTDVATKRKWRVTEAGQELLELSHHYKAAEKILSSLKSRLYDRY